MSIIHKNYNLDFVSQNWENEVHKTCNLTKDNIMPSYTGLSLYLVYMQFPEDIMESILPEVESALNGNDDDVDVSVETVSVSVGQIITEIGWGGGYVEKLPTIDFKQILIEYYNFLITPPLEGTKIK